MMMMVVVVWGWLVGVLLLDCSLMLLLLHLLIECWKLVEEMRILLWVLQYML